MKTTLYKIHFADGSTDTQYALSPKEAMILAQAEAIMQGRPYVVDSVRNEENGYVFQVGRFSLKES